MFRVNIPVTDIEIYRGDDITVPLLIGERNEVIDFNDAEVKMTIKPQSGQEITLELDSGLDISYDTENTIDILFSHDLTKDWQFRTATYDLQYKSKEGKVKTYMKGSITVIPDVTR